MDLIVVNLGESQMLEVVFSKKNPLAKTVKVILMFEASNVRAECLTAQESELVKKAIVQANFNGEEGSFVEVFGGRAKILLAGLGKKRNDLAVQKVGRDLFAKLYNDEKAYIAAIDDETAKNVALGVLLGSYSFDKYKTEKKADEFPKLEQIMVGVKKAEVAQEDFKQYLALATAVRYAKDLCNEPANYLTPDVFAKDVERLRYLGLKVEVLDEKEIKLQGLGLIDAVGKGAKNPPRMVVAAWIGNRASQDYDLAIVGKGICFDAGGLSLKPTPGMIEMKMDMAGAAVAIASLKAAALQRIRKNIVAVMGVAENMPGENAMKIGDVYTAYNGKTVEIMNADAEGRLLVADCLAYVQKNYRVKSVVDMATLGSLKTTLGNVYSGLFANDKKLADKLVKAGEKTGEKLWPMPLDNEYDKKLSSPIADIRNVAVDSKASVVSAAFLEKFVEKGNSWAHIDISGVRLDKSGLASGFGVMLLNEFIRGL